ncbi:MAG: hypothetical protein KBC43_07705 [Bacteroidales bacterium]|nr:hypothetical protein [Bacteroidales bacterium]
MRNLLLSLLTFLLPFIASSQPMSSVAFFPENWAIPSMDNVPENSGWDFLIRDGNDKPYYVFGDFNGDNFMDEAWLLMHKKAEVWGLWVFLNDLAGGYKSYVLGGMGDDFSNPKVLARCSIFECMIYSFGDKTRLCMYDDNLNVIEQKDSEYDLLGFGVFEVGNIHLFYYNRQNDVFEKWLDCNADPED